MYLKRPRRRCEQKIIRKLIEKYRCVPKIASPEARNFFIKKTFRATDPRVRALSLVRGECTTALQNALKSIVVYLRNIFLLENLQGHRSTSPGAEPSAGRWWWWRPGTERAREKVIDGGGGKEEGGEGGGGGKEERRGREGVKVK